MFTHVETLEPRQLLSGGTFDRSFGDNGRVYLDAPVDQVLYGSTDDGAVLLIDNTIARLNADGSYDASFSDGNDTLFGFKGDDLILGNGGNDLILGNDGRDTLAGGNGGDVFYGGRGIDTIFGGRNVDRAAASDEDVFNDIEELFA